MRVLQKDDIKFIMCHCEDCLNWHNDEHDKRVIDVVVLREIIQDLFKLCTDDCGLVDKRDIVHVFAEILK